MNYQDLMAKENYCIAFKNIGEADYGVRIIVYGSGNETDLLTAPHHPVDVYQLDFPSYAAYSVTFEDFTSFDKQEVYEGEAFRIYKKSHLLDSFYKKANLKEQEENRGAPYRHYSLACMEHQVDVVAIDEPTV